jgi:hypothetical protein
MSEIEGLRAELERLRLDAVDEARWAVAQFRRAEAAEAERDRLREAVGRIKALLDKEDARVAEVNERLERRELETKTGSPYRVVGIVTTREIRAILDATP